jgi:tetratricopeptide (TPR) repeat protein
MAHKFSFCFSVFLLLKISCFGQEAADLIEKGQREVQNGEYEAALIEFNKAIDADAEYLDAYVQRAFVYSMLKEYEKAIIDYTKLIELNPNFATAYLSRGSAFNKLELFDKALVDFDKVIILDPLNSEAYNNRGWSKKGLGDKDGACSDWKTSKKMGNGEAKIILKNNQC